MYIDFMDASKEIIIKLTALKPILHEQYGVKNIGLFGSFANNTYSAKSDIDLLVELEKPIGWAFFSMEAYLESIFKRKIDLVTHNALKDDLKDHILSQVIYI